MVKMCIVMALSEDWEEEVRGRTKKDRNCVWGRGRLLSIVI